MTSRDDYVESLKTAALQIGVKAVMNVIVTRIPFLGSWFISPILGFFVGKVLEIALRQTEMGAFFLFIDTRTSRQGRDFAEAARLNAIAQQTGTEEEKKHAEERLKTEFRNFVLFTS